MINLKKELETFTLAQISILREQFTKELTMS